MRSWPRTTTRYYVLASPLQGDVKTPYTIPDVNININVNINSAVFAIITEVHDNNVPKVGVAIHIVSPQNHNVWVWYCIEWNHHLRHRLDILVVN